MANGVDPDQTASIGAVCSGSTLFATILNSSVLLGIICSRRLQQTTFSDASFHGALRVKLTDKYTECSGAQITVQLGISARRELKFACGSTDSDQSIQTQSKDTDQPAWRAKAVVSLGRNQQNVSFYAPAESM